VGHAKAVFALVLFCLLIPVHAIALPLYIMLAKVGLTNTYAASSSRGPYRSSASF
jgi:ABC-type glycerol-3-phosphate transport system permease component